MPDNLQAIQESDDVLQFEKFILLQIGIAELQLDLVQENLYAKDIVNLIDRKKGSLKNALKCYSEGDILLSKLHLDLSVMLEEELRGTLKG